LCTAAALALGALLVLGPWPVAVVGVLVLGVGFAAPFARLYDLGASMHPGQTASASAFLSAAGSAFALVVLPFVGADVQGGGGIASLVGLAVFGVVAAAVAGIDEPRAASLRSASLERI
jgi:hypothetical protein